jgi:hypothetical protein
LDYIFELKLKTNDIEKNIDKDSIRPRKKSKEKIINEDNTSNFNMSDNLDSDINSKLTGNDRKLYVDYGSAQVESFLVSEKPYQQLSDHFGLSVDLKFDIDFNK